MEVHWKRGIIHLESWSICETWSIKSSNTFKYIKIYINCGLIWSQLRANSWRKRRIAAEGISWIPWMSCQTPHSWKSQNMVKTEHLNTSKPLSRLSFENCHHSTSCQNHPLPSKTIDFLKLISQLQHCQNWTVLLAMAPSNHRVRLRTFESQPSVVPVVPRFGIGRETGELWVFGSSKDQRFLHELHEKLPILTNKQMIHKWYTDDTQMINRW